MTAATFTLQSSGALGYTLLGAIVIPGVALIGIAFVGKIRKSRSKFITLLVSGLIIIGVGISLSQSLDSSPTVKVGTGYVAIQSSSFGAVGDMNITSTSISQVFVSPIGQGNFTISKQHGTDYGDVNFGVFTLGNGHTAYIMSVNMSSDLIMLLNDGNYVIIGTQNTSSLVNSFIEMVHPLTN